MDIEKEGKVLKYYEGKIDLTLLDPLIWEGMCRPYEYGLTKYSRDSWKKFTLEEARALMPSALRHINSYRKGQFYDKESRVAHLTMAMFNLATIYYHEITQGEYYDKAP